MQGSDKQVSRESGGRADKLGNRYEDYWAVELLLRLVDEKLEYLIIEPLGKDEEGTDILTLEKSGNKVFYQCKGSNTYKDKWTLADLNSSGILKNAFKQISRGEINYFKLVSSVGSVDLNELHDRSKDGSDSLEEYKERIGIGSQKSPSQRIKDNFCKVTKYLELDISKDEDILRMQNFLSRFEVILYPDNSHTKMQLLDKINLMFSNNSAEAVRNDLKSFAIEEDYLGTPIYYKDIIHYLEMNSVKLSFLEKDKTINPKINEINRKYIDSIRLIDDNFISRIELTDNIKRNILKNDITVIHGKAGVGKSGVLLSVLNGFECSRIPTLSIRLDKDMPENNLRKFGKNIGLPNSPVACLDSISYGQESVLVIDQLDALRWTNEASKNAVDICRELIRQTNLVNESRDRKIHLVFACRTVDYQQDPGIKSLFLDENRQRIDTGYEIGQIDELLLEKIVGTEQFLSMTAKQKNFLRTLSNLYIWKQLDVSNQTNQLDTTMELINTWWNQLEKRAKQNSIEVAELIALKERIVSEMSSTQNLEIIDLKLGTYSRESLLFMESEGLININKHKISFVHQSFLDNYMVQQMIIDYHDGSKVEAIIGERDTQTPIKRFRFQLFLTYLLENDINDFLNLINEILNSDSIRFYYKYIYLEVFSQINEITEDVVTAINILNSIYKLEEHIWQIVYYNQPVFLDYLMNNGYLASKIKEKPNRVGNLLASLDSKKSYKISDFLKEQLFKDEETDMILSKSFPHNLVDDSEELFLIRLRLYNKYPQLIHDYYLFDEILEDSPKKFLFFLDCLLQNKIKSAHSNMLEIVSNLNIELFLNDKLQIADIYDLLFKHVPKDSEMPYIAYSDWEGFSQYNSNVFQRSCVALLIKASKYILEHDMPLYLQKMNEARDCTVANEIILASVTSLGVEYSDNVITWLIQDNFKHAIDETSTNIDELYYAKRIVEKYTKHCSFEVLSMFEEKLYYRKSERIKWYLERKIDEDKNYGLSQYRSFFGELQYCLIPYIDKSRVSIKMLDLFIVLERKFAADKELFKKNLTEGGGVSASIPEKYAKNFSNKTWKELILNNKVPLNRAESYKYNKLNRTFYESTVEQFSNLYRRCGISDPNRFISLIISIQKKSLVNIKYLAATLDLMSQRFSNEDNLVTNTDFDVKLAETFIGLNMEFIKNTDLGVNFCDLIYAKIEKNWSSETLELLEHIACNHSNPKKDYFVIIPKDEKEKNNIEFLHSNSINVIRGKAFSAIQRAIWNQKILLNEKTKNLIDRGLHDEHYAVRYAAFGCLVPCYNHDERWAMEMAYSVYEVDYKFGGHIDSIKLIPRMGPKGYSEKLIPIITKMFFSDDNRVCDFGAQFVTLFYIVNDLYKELVFSTVGEVAERAIIKIAITYFSYKDDLYKEKCKEIILAHCNSTNDVRDYSLLFSDREVDINKDASFIIDLMESRAGKKMINIFIEYLYELDEAIEKYSDAILKICKSFIDGIGKNQDELSNDYYIEPNKLSGLLISLYDKNQKDKKMNKRILDIWDLMFENNIGVTRKFSRDIMDI